MCKKSNLLLVFAIVVLVLPSITLAADPNMIAIYWMDAGEGATVWDYSGNGLNGTINGAVSWSGFGKIGGGLEFSGGTVDIIRTNVDDLSFGDVDLSVTAWIKTANRGNCFFSKVTADGEGNSFAFGAGQNGDDGLAVVTNRNRINIKSTTEVDDNEWHHLAFVQDYDEAGGSELWSMYVDGVLETRQLTDILRDNGRGGMYIGQAQDYLPANWSGMVDELYIYGSVLDDADMAFVMEGATWKPRARDLQPVDGTVLSGTSVDLSWSAGWADTALGEHLSTDAHRVYLSTDANAVSEGKDEALVDTITVTTYSVADLTPNTTYYWRIDEVNDTDATSPWTGEVLSFSVPDLDAKNPVPADGTKFQSLDLDLGWTPGLGATSHVVYLGNASDEVENATSGGVTVSDPNYAPPGLQADKIFFWRVDEVNGGTIKGPVWSFSTVPVADGDHIDPNMIAWWKMNEGEGSTVVDYSGYGNHASFVGAGGDRLPQWDEGIFGGAVRVWDSEAGDGLGYIDVPGIPGFDSPEITICGWVYLEELPGGWGYPFWTVPTLGSDQASIFFVNGNMRLSWPTGNYLWVHGWDVDSGLPLPVGEWFFIGVSVKPDGADYYVNNATFHRTAGFVPLTTLDQGANLGRAKAKNTPQTVRGKVDDWRMYSKALTAAELTEVMRGEPWLAWDPRPGTGTQTDVLRASTLSWKAGDDATAHDVYLSTDSDALQNADVNDTAGVYHGRQTETSYALGDVQQVTTYYWRIDEVQADGSIRKGNAWSFTTANFLILDDFEDYDVSNNEIWWTWKDGIGYASHPTLPDHPGNGTGSMVGDETTGSYMEETIVHGGSQSMPVFYDNSVLMYSEVEKTLSYPRDWTENGVSTLTIWFRGDSDNAAETLYVVLNGSAVVNHDNPNAAQITAWTEWTIDLQTFGVNLANVNTIGLGLGDRNNPQAGGSGVMYFDDIRLYPPVPEPAP